MEETSHDTELWASSFCELTLAIRDKLAEKWSATLEYIFEPWIKISILLDSWRIRVRLQHSWKSIMLAFWENECAISHWLNYDHDQRTILDKKYIREAICFVYEILNFKSTNWTQTHTQDMTGIILWKKEIPAGLKN